MCLDKYEDNDYKGLYALCCNESDWREKAKLARTYCKFTRKTGCVIWTGLHIKQN